MKIFNKFGIFPVAALVVAAMTFLTGCHYMKEAIAGKDLPEVMKSDMSLAEVVARNEKATDRKGLFEKCTSYMMEQEMVCKQEGKEACYKVKTIFKKPDNLKTVTYRNGILFMTVLYNGKQAWAVTPQGTRPIEGKSFKLTKELADIIHPSKTLLDVFKKIDLELIREDTKEYYKLTCYPKLKGMAPMIIYVGKNNFLTKRMTTQYTIKGKLYTYESIVDRYTTTDYPGVLLAEKQTVISNGATQILKLVDFKMNLPISDKEFSPPDWYNQGGDPMKVLQDAQKYKPEPDKYKNSREKPKRLNIIDS